jgi:hypothetical protein
MQAEVGKAAYAAVEVLFIEFDSRNSACGKTADTTSDQIPLEPPMS